MSFTPKRCVNFIDMSDHGFVFCFLQKVACTGFKIGFRTMKGLSPSDPPSLVHDRQRSGLTFLSDLPPERTEALLNDRSLPKVVFYRHPVKRTVSAFVDKFRLPKRAAEQAVWDKHARKIMDVLGEPVACDKGAGRRLSFANFVTFVEQQPDHGLNGHWAPQHYLSCAGDVAFDFVGHLETMGQDVARLNDTFGLSIALPQREASSIHATPGKMRADDVAADRLDDKALLRRLEARFAKDFKAGGYTVGRG